MKVSATEEARLIRLEADRKALGAKLDPAKVCFPKQRTFVEDRSRFRTGCTSRRAGKTAGAAAALIDAVQSKPGSIGLYIAKTRLNAKRILWRTLLDFNRELGLGGRANVSDLCVTFPNGSTLYLAGVNDREQIENFRGLPIAIVVVDEAQSLPSAMLQSLIDEVLAPALMDWDGGMVLIGTPSPVPVGYFHECTHSSGWSSHEWTVFENPWILKKSGKTPEQHLQEELARRGVSIDDPVIQREWFGRWVLDLNSLVFRYSAERNDFTSRPAGEWECVLSADLGYDDADALAVLGWQPSAPGLYLLEEHVLPKQTITQLGDRMRKLADAWHPLAVVADTGGLGKKIAEELTSRWSLNVEAAEKERKLEHIELLNDALRSGRLFAKKESQFAQDCMLVEWDKSNPEKWAISDRFHSDICDAVLYGYRRALHWLHEPAPEAPPRPGTELWAQKQAEEMERHAREDVQREVEYEREQEDIGRWL